MPGRNHELLEKRNQHVPQGPFNTTTAFIKEAHGAVMVDVDGRELIDFAGGIGVNNVGHCHPKVVAAIQDQAANASTPAFMWPCTRPTWIWPHGSMTWHPAISPK